MRLCYGRLFHYLTRSPALLICSSVAFWLLIPLPMSTDKRAAGCQNRDGAGTGLIVGHELNAETAGVWRRDKPGSSDKRTGQQEYHRSLRINENVWPPIESERTKPQTRK